MVRAGDIDVAVKHFMIAARIGDDESLKELRRLFLNGRLPKSDFEMALRAHKEASDEMKSEQRAAVASNEAFHKAYR